MNRSEANCDSEEGVSAKIQRLAREIDELKKSRDEAQEGTAEWFQICSKFKDKDTERILLIEKCRCDGVVSSYFEGNPHVLEAVPECPICLEKLWDFDRDADHKYVKFFCCGNLLCTNCEPLLKGRKIATCPLCRLKCPIIQKGNDALTLLIEEKVEKGVTWAMIDVGIMYLNGTSGKEKDVQRGLSLVQDAAEKGDARALCFLGDYYYFENDDIVQARRWYKAAAAKGSISSIGQLGSIELNAKRGTEEKKDEALRQVTVATALLPRFGKFLGYDHFADISIVLALHYLRPAVEDGSEFLMKKFAAGLIHEAAKYYGNKMPTTNNPIPEALFWYRRSNDTSILYIDQLFNQIEGQIRLLCAYCHAKLAQKNPPCCVECRAAFYCGRECQVAHWKAGHKKDCIKKLKRRLREEGKLGDLE